MYLKGPFYIKNRSVDWSVFFKSWVLLFLISIPFGPIINFVLKVTSITETEFNYSNSKIFITMIFLSPVIEEILFRLILKPKFRNILIFSVFSGVLAINFLFRKSFTLGIPFCILSIVCIILLLDKKCFRRAQIYFLKHFSFFFYLICLIFGFVHISNYEPFNYKLVLILPILITPLVFAGITLSFIRMRFGIGYSMLMHSMMNFIAFLAFLVGK
jgi:membrane protease YdiL (CAAX protease family)